MPRSKSKVTLAEFIGHLHGHLPGKRAGGPWNLERWLEWPPDVFALTTLIFESSGSYIYAASPPDGRPLPHQEDWEEFCEEQVEGWRKWMDGHCKDLPSRLSQISELLRRLGDLPLERLRDIGPAEREEDDEAWEVCLALLDLHCLADSASVGYGIPLSLSAVMRSADASLRHFMANMLLNTRGSLSRLPLSQVVVLPKMRTPRVGVTLRALSHHLTAHRTEVEVIWRSIPWISRDENVLNFVIVPWPYEVSANAFQPVSLAESFGSRGGRFFRYEGGGGFEAEKVVRLIHEAEKRVRRVHVVVLPELAVTEPELRDLKGLLAGHFSHKKVPLILSGWRSSGCPEGELGSNRVVLSSYFAGKWFDLYQDKHHRWKLESTQLRQYGLKGLFPGNDEWWEAIRIPPRQLTFLSPTGWLTLCPLICEDLARLDPVSPLIRGVGPSLLVAVLLDGPQLHSRWSARYAAVLAEDPGTSVLTVSSLGMSLSGKTSGQPARLTVAMWKDLGEWKELDIEKGDHGLLLSVRAEMEEELTLDGRSDRGNAAVFRYQGHWRLRVPKNPPKLNEVKNPFIKTDEVDLEELSRFSQLIDNAIAFAADDDAFACLFSLARGTDPSKLVAPWFGRCRYATGLWALIHEELDGLYAGRPDFRADYELFLSFLRHILDGARRTSADTPRPMSQGVLLERLIHLAEAATAEAAVVLAGSLSAGQDGAEAGATDSADAPDMELLPADILSEPLPEDLQEVLSGAMAGISEAKRGRIRIPLMTFLAILWAIHRRIVPSPKVASRPRPPLDHHSRLLLKRTEKLLAIEYWRFLEPQAPVP